MCPNLRIRGHLPASIINGEGDSLGKWTNFPNKFEGLVTLTLTLDRFILHAAMDHSSTSTYIPNFIEIEETIVDGRTDGRTDRRTFETACIRSTRRCRTNRRLSDKQQPYNRDTHDGKKNVNCKRHQSIRESLYM